MSFVLLGILNAQAAGAGAAGNFDLLETTTLGTATASVTFDNLDSYSAYKHLQIRAVSRTNRGGATGDYLKINFNSNTNSADYNGHFIQGTGSAVQSSNFDNSFILVNRATGSTAATDAFGATVLDVLDFSSTSKNTTIRALGGTDDNITLASGVFLVTDAIPSVTVTAGNGSLQANSRFSIYGIKG